MSISQKTEWALVVALVLYIAFTPGFPAVRQFLSTGVGKAIGLGVIVATWKYASPLVALLLTVNYVRCSGMREFMTDGDGSGSSSGSGTGTGTGSGSTLPPNTYCPENHSFDNGQCKNNINGQTTPATVCLTGQTWDGTKCSGSSSATTPPPSTPPPSQSTRQGFAVMTPHPTPTEGFQPNTKDDKYAPA